MTNEKGGETKGSTSMEAKCRPQYFSTVSVAAVAFWFLSCGVVGVYGFVTPQGPGFVHVEAPIAKGLFFTGDSEKRRRHRLRTLGDTHARTSTHTETSTTSTSSSTHLYMSGGKARFSSSSSSSSSSSAGSVTVASVVDTFLTFLTSDVGGVVLGLVGLGIALGNRLLSLDDSIVLSGDRARADLLATFSSGAVFFGGVSALDVTTALAETVVLEGINVFEPPPSSSSSSSTNVDRISWAMASVLEATPARTAVVLTRTNDDDNDNDDEGEGERVYWKIVGRAGIVPSGDDSGSLGLERPTPILDRFWKNRDKSAVSTKETYLPTLQALPGKTEFTYLPRNTQEVLLLPVVVKTTTTTIMVLGSDTAKSFSPRDVAWCQWLASQMGIFMGNDK